MVKKIVFHKSINMQALDAFRHWGPFAVNERISKERCFGERVYKGSKACFKHRNGCENSLKREKRKVFSSSRINWSETAGKGGEQGNGLFG